MDNKAVEDSKENGSSRIAFNGSISDSIVDLPNKNDCDLIVSNLQSILSSAGDSLVEQLPHLNEEVKCLNSKLLLSKETANAIRLKHNTECKTLSSIIRDRNENLRKTIAVIDAVEGIVNGISMQLDKLQLRVKECEKAYQVGSLRKGVLKGLRRIANFSALRSEEPVEMPVWSPGDLDMINVEVLFDQHSMKYKVKREEKGNEEIENEIDGTWKADEDLLNVTSETTPKVTSKERKSARRTVEIEQLKPAPLSQDLARIRSRKKSNIE